MNPRPIYLIARRTVVIATAPGIKAAEVSHFCHEGDETWTPGLPPGWSRPPAPAEPDRS